MGPHRSCIVSMNQVTFLAYPIKSSLVCASSPPLQSDEAWYEATVARYDSGTCKHVVSYKDGSGDADLFLCLERVRGWEKIGCRGNVSQHGFERRC